MVRQLDKTLRTPAWKAVLAIVVAGGGLVWHMLACVESPMAYTPDGKQLLFTTRDPQPEKPWVDPKPGAQTFRVFALTDQKDLRVLDESTDHVLTAPGISADGKQIAYLRILIPEPAATEKKAEPAVKAKPEQADKPTTLPEIGDESMPSKAFGDSLLKRQASSHPLAAELVVRDLASGKVAQQIPVALWYLGAEPDYKGNEGYLGKLYALCKPLFSADGKEVYFCDGDLAYRVRLDEKKTDLIISGTTGIALSPDKKWLAGAAGEVVVFRKLANDDMTVYRKLPRSTVTLSPAWIDNDSVAVVSEGESVKTHNDGSIETDTLANFLRVPRTDEPIKELFKLGGEDKDKGGGAALNDLARSSQGRWVIVTPEKVLFLKPDGKVAKEFDPEKGTVVDSPTWRPDGKVVALKQITSKEDEEGSRTSEILFADPDGKELGKVAIPAAKPAGGAEKTPRTK